MRANTRNRSARPFGLVTFVIALAACNGSATDTTDPDPPSVQCGPLPYFTALPVPAANILWVDVIGRIGAPSQTLPKGHTGAMLTTTGVPVQSPGNITIDHLRRVRYLASPWRQGETDYAIFYRVCEHVTGHFGHVASLAPVFQSGLAWSNCQTYSTADETVESCQADGRNLAFAAGQALGTVGSSSGMALDMGLVDRRVTHTFAAPARFPGDISHMVCPFEYYDATSQAAFFSKMTDPNTGEPTSGEPRCGTLQVDVAGTAQGVWAETAAPISVASEQHRFIALVNNPYQPQRELTLGLGPAALGGRNVLVPRETSGLVNRAFDQLTPNGVIHCYYSPDPWSPDGSGYWSWFIALEPNGSLKIEQVEHGEDPSPCSAENATWAFTGNAIVMVR